MSRSERALEWTLMTASHSLSVTFTSMRSRRIPALFTSTSRRPNAEIDCSIISFAPAKSLTSLAFATATPPALRISSTTSSAGRGASTVARSAEIVDHDLRAIRGEHERILSSDAAACPGDDHHAAFTESCHGQFPLRGNANAHIECFLSRADAIRRTSRSSLNPLRPGSRTLHDSSSSSAFASLRSAVSKPSVNQP
jgi:hypothetical protein